ncbi:hypothetical protein BD626DRAFT_571808 [Schizophyllum amplum]|uniref:DRBM domain-containing protein n=1 Tax=Schizophyllum amplum TaxID=97359 RepID=A0A550C6F5_9AGAR|nr:hypothetical protein BD626DRAFT_571808 [Auriculariopsis ampla]
MASPSAHWKTRLHNRVKGYGWAQPVADFTPFGQPNNCMWLCIVRINGEEFGRGDAPTKAAAGEIAAQRACAELDRRGYP